MGAPRPANFCDEFWGDWGPWVLEHGIPVLPAQAAEDESYPVARWIATEWAAVLHLSYRSADGDDPASLETDDQAFRRVRGEWQELNGGGGTNWFDGLELARPSAIGPDEAHAICEGWVGAADYVCGIVQGVAGINAANILVEQNGTISEGPVDSPLGAWIVAFDGARPVRIVIRSSAGAPLLHHEVKNEGRV